jgi:hypothetical protein
MLPKTTQIDPGRKLTLYVPAVDNHLLDVIQPYLKSKKVSLSELVIAFVERLVTERNPSRDRLDKLLDQIDFEL